jgi:arylsulfatase A-like enzyme
LVLLTGLAVFGGQIAKAEPLKPDILFLMPDEMRGDCLSVLGHPAVRTPQLDEQIVPLIAEFKERSRKARRPWVILVTADHGEMLGDHGFFRKCELFEGSANIPFLVAASPELGFKGGMRSLQPVCLEEVIPTLLALAGARCPKPMDGVSLVPTLRGGKQVVRECLHFEHAPCYSQKQAFHALTAE